MMDDAITEQCPALLAVVEALAEFGRLVLEERKTASDSNLGGNGTDAAGEMNSSDLAENTPHGEL